MRMVHDSVLTFCLQVELGESLTARTESLCEDGKVSSTALAEEFGLSSDIS